jgi:hypothetical protein
MILMLTLKLTSSGVKQVFVSNYGPNMCFHSNFMRSYQGLIFHDEGSLELKTYNWSPTITDYGIKKKHRQ